MRWPGSFPAAVIFSFVSQHRPTPRPPLLTMADLPFCAECRPCCGQAPGTGSPPWPPSQDTNRKSIPMDRNASLAALNMKKTTVELTLGGRTISIETGYIAKQANGSVIIRSGETMVLSTVCDGDPRPGLDFFPLTVDYREKHYAVGRIPGNFFKREARPSDWRDAHQPPDRSPPAPTVPCWLQARHLVPVGRHQLSIRKTKPMCCRWSAFRPP